MRTWPGKARSCRPGSEGIIGLVGAMMKGLAGESVMDRVMADLRTGRGAGKSARAVMEENKTGGHGIAPRRLWRVMLLFAPVLLGLGACAPDYVARKITGRECQAGYLEDGQDWCAPPERTPPPQPYCTKSWNGVDCWARPELTPNMAREVYEGPRGLTQQQNANRLMLPEGKIPPSNPYYAP